MAYKEQTTSYNFTPKAKATMIMILEQYPEYMATIQELRGMLTVQGSVVLPTYYAVLLARIVQPHYPNYSAKILAPLESVPAMTSNEYKVRWFSLLNRVA